MVLNLLTDGPKRREMSAPKQPHRRESIKHCFRVDSSTSCLPSAAPLPHEASASDQRAGWKSHGQLMPHTHPSMSGYFVRVKLSMSVAIEWSERDAGARRLRMRATYTLAASRCHPSPLSLPSPRTPLGLVSLRVPVDQHAAPGRPAAAAPTFYAPFRPSCMLLISL